MQGAKNKIIFDPMPVFPIFLLPLFCNLSGDYDMRSKKRIGFTFLMIKLGGLLKDMKVAKLMLMLFSAWAYCILFISGTPRPNHRSLQNCLRFLFLAAEDFTFNFT